MGIVNPPFLTPISGDFGDGLFSHVTDVMVGRPIALSSWPNGPEHRRPDLDPPFRCDPPGQ